MLRRAETLLECTGEGVRALGFSNAFRRKKYLDVQRGAGGGAGKLTVTFARVVHPPSHTLAHTAAYTAIPATIVRSSSCVLKVCTNNRDSKVVLTHVHRVFSPSDCVTGLRHTDPSDHT